MGKKRDFFTLWCVCMDAAEHPDDDKFGKVCEDIFSSEYLEGKEAIKWLDEAIAKIQDPIVAESLRDAVENILTKEKYFYLMIGFALAKNYDISSPAVCEEINYLASRMHRERLFPLMAKQQRCFFNL